MTAPRRALIAVDVQQEYFTGILQIQAPPRDQTLANIVAALEVAEQQELPVVVVQHELPQGPPVFAVGSDSWSLHPEIEERLNPSWKRVSKDKGSVFACTDVAQWLAEREVDTGGGVGYSRRVAQEEPEALRRLLAAHSTVEHRRAPSGGLTGESAVAARLGLSSHIHYLCNCKHFR